MGESNQLEQKGTKVEDLLRKIREDEAKQIELLNSYDFFEITKILQEISARLLNGKKTPPLKLDYTKEVTKGTYELIGDWGVVKPKIVPKDDKEILDNQKKLNANDFLKSNSILEKYENELLAKIKDGSIIDVIIPSHYDSKKLIEILQALKLRGENRDLPSVNSISLVANYALYQIVCTDFSKRTSIDDVSQRTMVSELLEQAISANQQLQGLDLRGNSGVYSSYLNHSLFDCLMRHPNLKVLNLANNKFVNDEVNSPCANAQDIANLIKTNKSLQSLSLANCQIFYGTFFKKGAKEILKNLQASSLVTFSIAGSSICYKDKMDSPREVTSEDYLNYMLVSKIKNIDLAISVKNKKKNLQDLGYALAQRALESVTFHKDEKAYGQWTGNFTVLVDEILKHQIKPEKEDKIKITINCEIIQEDLNAIFKLLAFYPRMNITIPRYSTSWTEKMKIDYQLFFAAKKLKFSDEDLNFSEEQIKNHLSSSILAWSDRVASNTNLFGQVKQKNKDFAAELQNKISQGLQETFKYIDLHNDKFSKEQRQEIQNIRLRAAVFNLIPRDSLAAIFGLNHQMPKKSDNQSVVMDETRWDCKAWDMQRGIHIQDDNAIVRETEISTSDNPSADEPDIETELLLLEAKEGDQMPKIHPSILNKATPSQYTILVNENLNNEEDAEESDEESEKTSLLAKTILVN